MSTSHHRSGQSKTNLPQCCPSKGKPRFLGISVHPRTQDELLQLVSSISIRANEKGVIANHNLHSALPLSTRQSNLRLQKSDDTSTVKLRAFYRAARYTHIDGMPIVALARLYGHRLTRNQRVTYVDWTGPLMELAARHHWKVFYLGSAPGVAEKGRGSLTCTLSKTSAANAPRLFQRRARQHRKSAGFASHW